jgi:tRNA pseudouridine32 synthase/23S rRNA pseudouridine746 synthase
VYLPKIDSPPATILDYLVQRFPQIPESTWRSRLERGLISTTTGVRLTENSPYTHGLMITYLKEVEAEPLPAELETIIYRDEEIIVADKPHGMVVTPAGDHVARSLLHRLQEATGFADLAPLHRLDKDTAGIIVLGIKRESRAAYHELFSRNRVQREYVAAARLASKPLETRWHVENRIGPSTPWFRQGIVEGPANAITGIELLEFRNGCGVFRLRPQTGKKHQLRVHMASLGFPIVGDRLYPELNPSSEPPLQLIAKKLSFSDPITGTSRHFESLRRLNEGLLSSCRSGE